MSVPAPRKKYSPPIVPKPVASPKSVATRATAPVQVSMIRLYRVENVQKFGPPASGWAA
jgi:hypothetical protein